MKNTQANDRGSVADPRSAALVILCLEDRPDYTLSQFPKVPRFTDVRDRALFRELLQGVNRNRLLIDWHLARFSSRPLADLDAVVRNTLRLGLYQLLFLDKVPVHASVNESVILVERLGKPQAKGFVNATLRNFLRELPRKIPAANNLAMRYSFPDELLVHLQAAFRWAGRNESEFEGFLAALNRPPVLTVRVNRLKTTRQALAEKWRGFDRKLEISETRQSPDGLTVAGVNDLTRLPGYDTGEFIVQGEASQMIAHLNGPFDRPLNILDACAPPGGKTTHLAELQGDRGRIIALAARRRGKTEDRATKRLRANIERLGMQSIEVVEKTAQEYAAHHPGKQFDRILVDAPCTGLGTLQKHPERKWAFRRKHAEKLAHEQHEILAAVAPLLKPDGFLIYSLCSLSVPEWEVAPENFKPVDPPLGIDWSPFFVASQKTVIFLPDRFPTEGFFARRFSPY